MKPIRITRSRQHKQISPNGLPIIYVGRPSKYGNPFKIVGDMIYGDASHRRKILSPWVYIELQNHYPKEMSLREILIDLYERWLNELEGNHLIPPPTKEQIISDLKGKNLSCWCKQGELCHADILLEIANK